ncbi:MAG: GAF domain-containing protein [Spirochaetes bacterium]|jgi:sigma-B regulation protein RsbU (phosphoserine phosphatase)|nr:GAF domain-containing protein [Spirochaetota bacterium]
MSDYSFDTLKKDYNNLQKLIEITKLINATLDIGKLLNTVMEAIKDILHTEASSLLFFDEMTDELVFKAVIGEKSDLLTEQYRFKTSQGIAGWCAANKETLIVNDVYPDPRFNPNFDKITGFKTNAIICAPLLFKGKLIGVIEGVNPIDRDDFNEDDMKLFTLFAEQAVMAVQNAIIFERSIERTKMQHEISSAQKLFEPFLKPITIDRDGMNITMISKPAGEFCGDIFTSRSEEDHIAIMLADAGVISLPGAITASYIAGKITAFGRVCRNCAEVIRYFHSSLKDIAVPKENSIFYGQLFTANNSLEYTASGTINLLLVKNNSVKLIKANSDLISGSIKRSRLEFNPGDTALIFTEGVTLLKNKHGESFGLKRLAKLIDPARSSSDILDSITQQTSLFSQNLKTFEDVTLMCIKRK